VRKANPAPKASHANLAALDELIEKITVDANGDAEPPVDYIRLTIEVPDTWRTETSVTRAVGDTPWLTRLVRAGPPRPAPHQPKSARCDPREADRGSAADQGVRPTGSR
jgi:hypothetical protein